MKLAGVFPVAVLAALCVATAQAVECTSDEIARVYSLPAYKSFEKACTREDGVFDCLVNDHCVSALRVLSPAIPTCETDGTPLNAWAETVLHTCELGRAAGAAAAANETTSN